MFTVLTRRICEALLVVRVTAVVLPVLDRSACRLLRLMHG